MYHLSLTPQRALALSLLHAIALSAWTGCEGSLNGNYENPSTQREEVAQPDAGSQPNTNSRDSGGSESPSTTIPGRDAGFDPLPSPTELPIEHDPNELDGASLFTCDESVTQASPAMVRRLTPAQYSARWSPKPEKQPLAPYIIDPAVRYSSDTTRDVIEESALSSMMITSMGRAGQYMKQKISGEGQCFWEQELPDEACLQKWARWQLERQYVRPPTTEEATKLATFTQTSLEKYGSEQGKRLAVAVTSMTVPFIYRTEVGAGDMDEKGRRMLAPYEVAKAIAYALAEGAPGEDIKGVPRDHIRGIESAAREDELRSPMEIKPWVEKFVGIEDRDVAVDKPGDSPKMIHGIRTFMGEFLGYMNAEAVFKSGGPYEPADMKRTKDLSGHTTDLVNRIVARDQDVLYELLTTRESFLWETDYRGCGDLSQYHYGACAEQNESFVELPASQRAGVLTQPSWLSAQSRNNYEEAHAVYRGKWIRENLLCDIVPELEEGIDAVLSEDIDRTLRDRLEEATDAPQCIGCHRLMNPLGLPFEIYDHRGSWRSEEMVYERDDQGRKQPKFLPVEASTTLVHMHDPELEGRQVRDAVEFMELLARSPRVEQCFVRQTFRYFTGRAETYADACTLDKMYQEYKDSGGSFKRMLITLFTSDTFLYRTVTSQEPMP